MKSFKNLAKSRLVEHKKHCTSDDHSLLSFILQKITTKLRDTAGSIFQCCKCLYPHQSNWIMSWATWPPDCPKTSNISAMGKCPDWTILWTLTLPKSPLKDVLSIGPNRLKYNLDWSFDNSRLEMRRIFHEYPSMFWGSWLKLLNTWYISIQHRLSIHHAASSFSKLAGNIYTFDGSSRSPCMLYPCSNIAA